MFEFILVDSPHLSGIKADMYTFGEHFRKVPRGQVYATFNNLGGDSTLIAPVPLNNEPEYRYSSIGPFVKHSTDQNQINQVDEVIRQVAKEGLSAARKKSKTY